MIYTYGDEAKWPAENAEHNTDYMYPEIEYTYDLSLIHISAPRRTGSSRGPNNRWRGHRRGGSRS